MQSSPHDRLGAPSSPGQLARPLAHSEYLPASLHNILRRRADTERAWEKKPHSRHLDTPNSATFFFQAHLTLLSCVAKGLRVSISLSPALRPAWPPRFATTHLDTTIRRHSSRIIRTTLYRRTPSRVRRPTKRTAQSTALVGTMRSAPCVASF